MRKQRDGEDTKERVLTAAQVLFAENGFSGTSLAMISEKCGISDGLILHHYQSKRNLYRQVLENLADRYAQELQQAREFSTRPDEMLEHTLTASFNFWKQDAAYQRISLWAYLEKQTELAEKESAITVGLVQAARHLQEQKMIDDRFNPMVLLTMIIGAIHYWIRYRDQFIIALHLTETPDELDRIFLEQMVDLVKKMARYPTPVESQEQPLKQPPERRAVYGKWSSRSGEQK